MGKLGRILAPIAAVLAIALAVASFFIYKGFQNYQKRAANLAETVEKSAKKLDTGTNSGLTSGISYTAPVPGTGTKEDGSLSYKNFKSDAATFEKQTGNVVKLAGNVITQRDELAEAIQEMTKTLGLPNDTITVEALSSLESYKDLLILAKSYAEAIRKKDIELAKTVQEVAASVGANKAVAASKKAPVIKETKLAPAGEEGGEEAEAKTVKTAVYDSQAKDLAQIKENIGLLQKRRQAYETAIKNLGKVVTAYKFKANLNSISGKDFEKVLVGLAADMGEINKRLLELNTVKKQLQQEKAKVQAAEKKIKTLEAEKEDLRKMLKEANDLLDEHGIRIKQKPDLTDKSQVDPSIKGKVIIDNSEWNYVVVDLGKKEVVPDIDVIISYNKEYLASGKIKKVEKDICLVEVNLCKTNFSLEGATVIISDSLGKVEPAKSKDEQ